jgi:hypothetical protein
LLGTILISRAFIGSFIASKESTMSGLPAPSLIKKEKLTPLAEFRRWLVVASVLAILGGCLALYRGSGDVYLFLALWCLFGANEGWVQFNHVARRAAWPIASLLTFAVLNSADSSYADLKVALLYLAPAFLEFLIALRERKRPWIWLIATPTIYGTAPIWIDALTSAAFRIMSFVSGFVSIPSTIRREVTDLVAILGVILITRAIVGSFIASRKYTV